MNDPFWVTYGGRKEANGKNYYDENINTFNQLHNLQLTNEHDQNSKADHSHVILIISIFNTFQKSVIA